MRGSERDRFIQREGETEIHTKRQGMTKTDKETDSDGGGKAGRHRHTGRQMMIEERQE